MSGRTRAKLVSILFLVFIFVLVFLPGGAGTNTNKSFEEAHPAPPNPHGTEAAFKQEPRTSSAKGHNGGLNPASFETAALLGGTCINCHVGITPAHTKAALKCVDCHGGNDKVETGPNPNIRDTGLMGQAHVLPKDSRFFWPNGISDIFAGAP